ncbi:hypothetical protein [Bacteroides sp. 51]|uniref:hypothetical protein n=1 Tax=Bacteroides sp. 51 TaxID=2302938 RepID=UPI0013D3BF7C|nr:hypothetical protein [Bacteroides sp. 51]NDV83388.1 hypothetical protein [Bacteroides sp. 51]
MKKIIVHKAENPDGTTTYYFTKSKTECLCLEYNKKWDYGKKDSSGTHISDIEIYSNNSFNTSELIEIGINEVPESIIDLLSFLT